jgi:hypothetical protein
VGNFLYFITLLIEHGVSGKRECAGDEVLQPRSGHTPGLLVLLG